MSLTGFALLLSLAVDVFAAGLAYGLSGLRRQRWIATAVIFSLFGIALPLIGIVAGRWLSDALGAAAGIIAAIVLIGVGVRALVETYLGRAQEATDDPKLSHDLRSISVIGLIVALDAMAVGFALAVADINIGAVLAAFAVQTFCVTLLGLALGTRLGSRLGQGAEALAGGVFVVYGVALLIQTARAQ